MREALRERVGQRARYTATFERWGTKRGRKGAPLTTLLLVDVRDATETVITDHLWCNLTVEFCRARLCPGDRIAFDGRSAPYVKGFRGRREDDDLPPVETDYRLSHPTRIEVIERATVRGSDEHQCHAQGCTVGVAPELLMCKVHWLMVPREMQRRVWSAYRPGQCDDKRPSEAWFEAANAAIRHVAGQEPAFAGSDGTPPGAKSVQLGLFG